MAAQGIEVEALLVLGEDHVACGAVGRLSRAQGTRYVRAQEQRCLSWLCSRRGKGGDRWPACDAALRGCDALALGH